MTEILGTNETVSYADGRLVVRELGSDGRERLRAGAADTLEAWCATVSVQPDEATPPQAHHLLLRLIFRSPDFCVDGTPSRRAPFDLELPLAAIESTKQLVAAVMADVRDTRRTPADRPVPPVPPREPGVMRADLVAALGRLVDPASSGYAASVTDTYLRADEAVLAAATTGPSMLLTATSDRILFVVMQPGTSVAHGYPLDLVEGLALEKDVYGRPTTVLVDDGFKGMRFQGVDPRDGQALVEAVMPVIEADRVRGRVGAATPGPVELFAEWQLLLERRALGMVADDDFGRTASGILAALP